MIQYKRNKEILCITQKLFKVVLEILYNFAVTPCVGVWIEIVFTLIIYAAIMSLPAWECGLKSLYSLNDMLDFAVTPCVGVWIEILNDMLDFAQDKWSLPAWECGLKSRLLVYHKHCNLSLPAWECGLKSSMICLTLPRINGHSLRGSVD